MTQLNKACHLLEEQEEVIMGHEIGWCEFHPPFCNKCDYIKQCHKIK